MTIQKNKLGRTPSINQTSIQRAVQEVANKTELTMRGVASSLGVNVTTLYRHTGGLEGLRKIYVLQLSQQIGNVPATTGKDWQQWLFELASFYRNAFLKQQMLLKYAQFALDPHFKRLEDITSILINYGFSALDAVRSHAFLINNVVGYVHQELQTELEIKSGVTPLYSTLAKTLKAGAQHLPNLSKLQLGDEDLDVNANFNYFINYALTAISAHITGRQS